MPILNPTPQAPPVEAPAAVTITSPDYKGVVVDTRYVPATSLLTRIEGASWTVNYYRQVLDQNNQLSGQQPNLDPSLQQYWLIKKMELKVQQPLAQNQNVTTGVMEVTGSAIVYPSVIPNVGDMFLADVGDGHEGVFQLTHSDKKTIFKDTAYLVEYKLVDFSTPERIGDLTAKTIKTLRFVRDFLDHGQDPIITEDDFTLSAELVHRFHTRLTRWVKESLNTEFMTLTLPGQTRNFYDPFFTKFISSAFSSSDCFDLSKIHVLNVDDDLAMRAYCLWDALMDKDRGMLVRGFKQAGSVSIFTFVSNPMFEGIRFSGLDSVIYPKDPDHTVTFPATVTLKILESDYLTPTSTDTVDLSSLIPNLNLQTADISPSIIKPVLSDNYYVFSQAFYDKATSGQSLLELCVQDYLDGNALNGTVLKAIASSTASWGLLERFYYIPILLVLIRAFVRGL